MFACAAFTIICAVGNWDWFMNHSKARLWINLFGRDGARIFYILVGLGLAGLGIMMLMNPET